VQELPPTAQVSSVVVAETRGIASEGVLRGQDVIEDSVAQVEAQAAAEESPERMTPGQMELLLRHLTDEAAANELLQLEHLGVAVWVSLAAMEAASLGAREAQEVHSLAPEASVLRLSLEQKVVCPTRPA
jgi:hypothetical protein